MTAALRRRNRARRIQRIQALVQIDAHRLAGIQPARGRDQLLREVGVDTPVARFVGIGQRRTRDAGAEAHVVQLATHRAQTGLDVPQALAIGELGEGHRQILIPAGEVLRVPVATIAGHALLKLLVGQMLDQLRKHGAARVHPPLSSLPPPHPHLPLAISNRSRPQRDLSRWQSAVYTKLTRFSPDSNDLGNVPALTEREVFRNCPEKLLYLSR